ncbi:hypothetical protein GGI12_005239, partial [Dipsacomyces acuminosporus]
MAAPKTQKKGGSSSRSKALEEIGGYKVLPVHFEDSDAVHYVYFRHHKAGKEDVLLPANRTIYMFNLPVDTTERDIRRLFQGVARVARVLFHDVVGQDIIKTTALEAKMASELADALAEAQETKDKKLHKRHIKQGAESDNSDEVEPAPRTRLLVSGASAHVVLLEEEELDSVLSMKIDGQKDWPSRDTEDSVSPLEYRGISRYMYEYRAARPPAEMLKKEVDSYMAKFEEAQYERERLLAQQANVPDEDGFITVVRRGRKNKSTDGTATVTAASAASAREAGQKKKEAAFGNMYRFQMRERKRDQLLELRKKFEEDKEKIARMPLQCLARIGTDVSFEAKEDELELIGINASRSAYASFKFQQHFFDAYYVAPLPAGQHNPAFRCKVMSKPLVGIFKLRTGPSPGHEIEKCILRIEQASDPVHIGANRRRRGESTGARGTQDSATSHESGASLVNAAGECRLVVQITYKQGICRTHRLFYEVCDTLHSVYDRNECKNRWRVSAKVAADWISHFARGLEEVSLWMSTRDVKVRSWAEGQYAGIGRSQIDAAVAETTRALQTELTVEPSEFDLYRVSGSHPTELTFGLREFKAILQYAEAMALPLAAFFDKGGDPILFSVCSPRSLDHSARGAYSQMPDDLSAEFVLATISDYASQYSNPNSTPARSSANSMVYDSRHVETTPHIRAARQHRHAAAVDQIYIQNTITPRVNVGNEDEISLRTASRNSGVTPRLHQQREETIYDAIDPNIVPSPSPYQSTRASNNNDQEMWVGADMEIDKSDS